LLFVGREQRMAGLTYREMMSTCDLTTQVTVWFRLLPVNCCDRLMP